MRILFVYPNLMLQTTFPMAISIFASILKKHGHSVDVFDTTFYKTEDVSSDERRVENLQIAKFNLGDEFRSLPAKAQMFVDLEGKVREFRPDLIAYSILEDLYPLAQELFRVTSSFRIPTIAGGLFPTFAPETVLSNDGIDIVCIGEGEGPLLELCEKMSDGRDITDTPNLWVKKNGTKHRNHLRPLRDLNANPPPDFGMFDDRRFYRPMKGKVYRMGLVETNRGCPYTCAFCNSYAQSHLYRQEVGQPYFRVRDVARIHDEIKLLVDKHKVEYLYFPAEVFLAGPKDHIMEFAKMYKRFRLPFFCQNRAEVLNEETVQYLEEMNCDSCAIGIEHGNEDFRRNVLNRKVSNETYIRAIRLMEKTKIRVSVNNIIGFPGETRELTFDTIRLNRNFSVYQVNAYFFTPYHGTALREAAIERGYIAADAQTSYITKGTIMNMPDFPPSEIHGLVRTFNLYVRFPESRYPEIALAERFDEEGNRVFERLKKEYWQHHLKVKP